MSHFRTINRDTGFLLPPSVDEWLPKRHLARFVVEIIEQLDLSTLEKAYRGTGSAPYHPAMLLGLLVYGYATGVFSSRKLERASYDSVAFRFIAGNEHPDHDTLAVFRKRFLPQIEALFVQVLSLARELGMLKLGTVALDGTKIEANASRHSALSYEHAQKIEAQLQREVQQLLLLADAADEVEIPDGLVIPAELERRETRLSAIAAAKAKIEARAQERFEREQAAHEQKLAARAEREKASGRKPGGKPPAPPNATVGPKEQVNLTDEDSRIMPVPGGGFGQCFNAQAMVATDSLLIVASAVTQASGDVQQLVPMLAKLAALPEALGRVEVALADCGYASAENVAACEAAKIEPLIALQREAHHAPWPGRFAAEAPEPANLTPAQAMAHRLATPRGRALYALRKQTPEPVFGIIKSVLGFRRFLLRGLAQVRGEWNLVTLSFNLKRMFALQGA